MLPYQDFDPLEIVCKYLITHKMIYGSSQSFYGGYFIIKIWLRGVTYSWIYFSNVTMSGPYIYIYMRFFGCF